MLHARLAWPVSARLRASLLQVGIFDADVYGPSLPTMTSPDPPVLQMDAQTKALTPCEYEGVRLVSFGFAGQGSAIMRGPMVSGLVGQLLTTAEWGARPAFSSDSNGHGFQPNGRKESPGIRTATGPLACLLHQALARERALPHRPGALPHRPGALPHRPRRPSTTLRSSPAAVRQRRVVESSASPTGGGRRRPGLPNPGYAARHGRHPPHAVPDAAHHGRRGAYPAYLAYPAYPAYLAYPACHADSQRALGGARIAHWNLNRRGGEPAPAQVVTTPQKLAFIDVAKGVRMFSRLRVPCVAVARQKAQTLNYQP